ncbi:MAG: glycosyltransferase [Flavobacteriales bacterium]|nr:glycosyltransferase [Flavobacteriales bacterium]
MKVSIITICYNNGDSIKQTIDSVVNQDYAEIEYIIIDGASTDNSMDVVRSFGNKIAKVISEPDKGIYDAMNKGVFSATGEVIGLGNAEDMLNSRDCISEIVTKFKETDADIVYGDLVVVKPENQEKIIRYWRTGEFNREAFKDGWMTPHMATYIKKEIYEVYGGFSLNFKISADYELMLRFMYKHNTKCVYLPKVIVKMLAGGVSNNSLMNYWVSNYEVYKSWKINNLAISPLIIIRKPLSKVFQFLRLPS